MPTKPKPENPASDDGGFDDSFLDQSESARPVEIDSEARFYPARISRPRGRRKSNPTGLRNPAVQGQSSPKGDRRAATGPHRVPLSDLPRWRCRFWPSAEWSPNIFFGRRLSPSLYMTHKFPHPLRHHAPHPLRRQGPHPLRHRAPHPLRHLTKTYFARLSQTNKSTCSSNTMLTYSQNPNSVLMTSRQV